MNTPTIEIIEVPDKVEQSFKRRVVSVDGFPIHTTDNPFKLARDLREMFAHLQADSEVMVQS